MKAFYKVLIALICVATPVRAQLQPHCKQRSRLFEAIEPSTSKRPRKGKTSIRKFVFSGNLRSLLLHKRVQAGGGCYFLSSF